MPRIFYIHYNAPGANHILCRQRYGPKTRHTPTPEAANCPRCRKILARTDTQPSQTNGANQSEAPVSPRPC